MFVGHTAVALAAKSQAPGLSLGALVAAAYGLDILWPVLTLIGLERFSIDPGNTVFTPLSFDAYPWSHSLLMAIVWGVVGAVLTRACGARTRAQVVIGLLVVSHWVLDFVTHRPDLPLWPGAEAKYGLALWNSVPGTLIVEGTLFVVCVAMYVRTTRAVDRTGTIAFWLLVGLQFVMWVTQPWSPPPPSPTVVVWVGIAAYLFPLWAGWADNHRRART